MSHYVKIFVFFLCASLFNGITYASPWFTGPILAPAGHTVPRGHTNFELYGIDVETDGLYNGAGKFRKTPLFSSVLLNPLLTHGFTDWLDVQLSVPYAFNSTRGVHYNRVTDSSVGVGLQLTEQKKSRWLPDIRFFVQETFPTGTYDRLNPAFLGTDATGLGSYRTLIAANIQYLKEIYNSHYLRTRFMISRLFSTPVNVIGFNSFGGTSNTQGRIKPGAEDNVDIAFEYTLTQNWVAVMEGYYSEGQATRFNGILDIVNNDLALIGSQQYYEYGLAPALEYNFNANVGVIGGVWFPVAGKNTSHFMAYVLAINAYW
ncbi:transporter [Legionella saoudiensis]|uniref:transporter n=1 Tax=Legionella saoudiensis TaxID=1750561 RepID=UPI000730AE95|nr:transporter [Legionella saoudiensis]